MRKVLQLVVLVLLLAFCCSAQTGIVKRNVNLRAAPSTANDPIKTLKPAAELDLIEPDDTDGFFHVMTSDGQEGWVWGRNIKINIGKPSPKGAGHIGPPQLYPDPVKTPGLAATLKLSNLNRRYTQGCPTSKKTCTYSEANRDVSESVHTQVYDEYNVPANDRNIKYGEVDHFYPLCAGGSNDIKNLWDQPAENEWKDKNFGFHEKDKLETFVCAQIKAGRMNPKDAFNRITRDWVKFYLDVALDSVD
jgi:hypothetical protein